MARDRFRVYFKTLAQAKGPTNLSLRISNLPPGQRWMWSFTGVVPSFPTLKGVASLGTFGKDRTPRQLQQLIPIIFCACLSYDLWPEYLASH